MFFYVRKHFYFYDVRTRCSDGNKYFMFYKKNQKHIPPWNQDKSELSFFSIHLNQFDYGY